MIVSGSVSGGNNWIGTVETFCGYCMLMLLYQLQSCVCLLLFVGIYCNCCVSFGWSLGGLFTATADGNTMGDLEAPVDTALVDTC